MRKVRQAIAAVALVVAGLSLVAVLISTAMTNFHPGHVANETLLSSLAVLSVSIAIIVFLVLLTPAAKYKLVFEEVDIGAIVVGVNGLCVTDSVGTLASVVEITRIPANAYRVKLQLERRIELKGNVPDQLRVTSGTIHCGTLDMIGSTETVQMASDSNYLCFIGQSRQELQKQAKALKQAERRAWELASSKRGYGFLTDAGGASLGVMINCGEVSVSFEVERAPDLQTARITFRVDDDEEG